MQSASPNVPRIIEEKPAGSLRNTPPPVISLPLGNGPKLKSAPNMMVPDIVVLEPTSVPNSSQRIRDDNSSQKKDDNSSTLGQITELDHDHALLSRDDLSEMVTKRDSDPTNPITNPISTFQVDLKIKQTTKVSYHDSVLLKEPKNHPSKIIHIPSSRDPKKIRGFLVPKDFEPVKSCKRRELPPESVPLKCQHDLPVDKRKGSCSLHGASIGFVCTCVDD